MSRTGSHPVRNNRNGRVEASLHNTPEAQGAEGYGSVDLPLWRLVVSECQMAPKLSNSSSESATSRRGACLGIGGVYCIDCVRKHASRSSTTLAWPQSSGERGLTCMQWLVLSACCVWICVRMKSPFANGSHIAFRCRALQSPPAPLLLILLRLWHVRTSPSFAIAVGAGKHDSFIRSPCPSSSRIC